MDARRVNDRNRHTQHTAHTHHIIYVDLRALSFTRTQTSTGSLVCILEFRFSLIDDELVVVFCCGLVSVCI